MKGKIYIAGVIGEDITLVDVIRQVKSYKSLTSLEVTIDSPGGYVTAGMDIYNYLRNQQVPVTTIGKRVYSIAATVFMAGDERIVEPGDGVLMVHLPWSTISGTSEVLRQASEQLASTENEFVTFYSHYLNLDQGTIRNLLTNETFLSSDEALEMGFATSVAHPQLEAMAFYTKEDIIGDINEEKNDTNMSKNINKFYLTLKNFFNEDSEVKALVIQDGVGNEINFTDLTVGDNPEQGERAVINNKPASGEYIMSDGSKYVFNEGKLSEIREAVVARAEATETEVQETIETAPDEVVNNETEVSDESTAEVEAPEEVEATESTEEVVEEEVSETVEEVIEAEVETAETSNQEVDVEALVTRLETSIMEKLDAKYKVENDALRAEIAKLNKNIGSGVEVQPTNNQRTNNNRGGNFLTDALRGK